MSRFQDWTSADERQFNQLLVRRSQVLNERRARLENALSGAISNDEVHTFIDAFIANAGPICDALSVFRTDMPEAA